MYIRCSADWPRAGADDWIAPATGSAVVSRLSTNPPTAQRRECFNNDRPISNFN